MSHSVKCVKDEEGFIPLQQQNNSERLMSRSGDADETGYMTEDGSDEALTLKHILQLDLTTMRLFK